MTSIKHRQLGTNGPSVSAVGLGCMSLSGTYGEADDAQSSSLIHHAIDMGVNHLDGTVTITIGIELLCF
jgi:aryl-alcohol dehydrogenase-like predicted oxidoreductase